MGWIEFAERLIIFWAVIDDLSLRDLGFVGSWYTWERGKVEATCIHERLDRFLCTPAWLDLYPSHVVEHLVRYKSDHALIITRPKKPSRPRRKNRGFRFETSWLLDDQCESVVRQAWDGSAGLNISARLEAMAQQLLGWSKVSFTKLDKQIVRVERQLGLAQQQPVSDSSCKECSELEKALDDIHEKQEAYWYLRSRVSEVKDGDRNTKYFHHKASQRRKRNSLTGLFDSCGVWRTEEDDIENIFEAYVSSIFESTSPSDSAMQQILQYVRPIVSAECNQKLLKPFTKDEIFATLQQMHPCKAPGPDGMHVIFYQRFWHIIGDDVTTFVSNILHGISLPSCINNTNIPLIPKVKDPTQAAEFRPIALCNVLYKLVSKAIVMRLKSFLPDIVSENQSAFVPGCLKLIMPSLLWKFFTQ